MEIELLKNQIKNNNYFSRFALALSLVNKKMGKINQFDKSEQVEIIEILQEIIEENMFLQENYMIVKK